MKQAKDSYLRRLAREKGRIAWTILAVLLILMPIVAVSKLVVATDDELDDIVAQSMLEFTTATRAISISNHGGAIFTYDVAIMKAKTQVRISNLKINNMRMGYWRGGYWDTIVDNGGEGAVLGGVVYNDTGNFWASYPLIFNGMRMEVAFYEFPGMNHTSRNSDFIFLRIGTDDLTGSVEFNYNGGAGASGALERLSSDARLVSNLSVWPLAQQSLNVNVASVNTASMMGLVNIDTGYVHRLFYGNTGIKKNTDPTYGKGEYVGRTDFYLSFADAISTGSGVSNTTAWNPAPIDKVLTTIPGRGFWLHFQRCYGVTSTDVW